MFIYAVPTMLGIIFWTVAFHRGLIDTAFLPLLSSQRIAFGSADLLSILREFGLSQRVSYGVPLVLLVIIVVFQKIRYPVKDAFDLFSFYALLSLLLFYHSSYDHLFLSSGCALVAISSRSAAVKLLTFFVVGYFWFGLRAISFVSAWTPPIVANNVLLCILLGTLIVEIISAWTG